MPFIQEYKQRQLRQLAQKEETWLTVQCFAYAVILLLSSVALQHMFKCCRRVMLRSKWERKEKPDLLVRTVPYITKVNLDLFKQKLLSSLAKNRLCRKDTIKSINIC